MIDGEALARWGSATVLEALERPCSLDAGIRPLWTPLALAGPAFTVAARPGDNLPAHRAVAEAPRGSVLVVRTGSCEDVAVWGEVLTVAAMARGLVGLITDGAVRDAAAIRKLGFPVFCRGRSPRGPAKRDPGQLGEPVSLAGRQLTTSDWVVADEDGVVVVPSDRVREVSAAAEERAAREDAMMHRIRAGELTLDLMGLRGLLE